MKTGRLNKIYWHDAFFDALQLELHGYRDYLTFEDEKQLSKEALRIDVLIVKKKLEVKIEKNFGKIFKGYNIFEFKSEKDKLEISDYNKVMGYAYIYSSFENVAVSDISLTFVVTVKPLKLLKYLEADRGFTITESQAGIYYVQGDHFPIQIIENKRLTKSENLFLKNLRSNLTADDLASLLENYANYAPLDKVNAYLNRILEANKQIFEEGLNMSEEAFEIIDNFMKKNGRYDKALEEGKKQTALEMLRDGLTVEKVAQYAQMPIEWVENLKTGL